MARNVVGLDISSRRLLAAEISGAAGKIPTLVRAHEMPLPEGAARDSEVIDVTAVSLALTQLWKAAGFQSKRVVLGVGNQRVLVRNHNVPVMPESQLRQALPYLIADLLPVPIDETILDFYPIEEVEGTSPVEMRGLLVAALKESVETDVATLSDAGLTVMGVDLAPFAMVRALNLAETPVGTHMIVRVGPRTTHLVVTREGVPQFLRTLPAGGDTIIEAVASAIGVSFEEAEQLKYSVGIDQGAKPEYRAASDAQLEALRGILASIRSTIGYYAENYSGEDVSSIRMLGATCIAPGFVRAVSEHVGLPAMLASTLAGIRVGSAQDQRSLQALEYDLAVPIGLALGRS